MKSRITANLSEAEATSLTKDFASAVKLRRRLVELLEKDIETLHTGMRDEDILLSPSWAYFQADRVAQVKALKKIISLIE
jgi:hypothetical protein